MTLSPPTEDLVLTLRLRPGEAFRDHDELRRHKSEGWRVESAFVHQPASADAVRLCTVRLSRERGG